MYVDVAAMPSQDRGSTPLTSIALFSIPSPGRDFYVFAKALVLQRLAETFIIALNFWAEPFLPPFSEKRTVFFSVFSVFCPAMSAREKS